MHFRLAVFGVGYVGLVTSAGLSALGHEVLTVDIDQEKIDLLKEGTIPIYEPHLGELVQKNVRNKRLHFSTTLISPFDEADIYFIAVGTPPSPNGTASLDAVWKVADWITQKAEKPALLCVKSTVPLGTCDKLQKRVASSRVPLEVVSNPEFLKEGNAVNDFFKPDRIIVGVRSQQAQQTMRHLYAPLQLSSERILFTDPRSSELIKYASNTMLAIRISFMNELSQLCDATGADIHDVRLGIGSDPRIGKQFLYAGPGYGGSCFPKDVKALIAFSRSHQVPMRIAEAAEQANEAQSLFVHQLVTRAIGDLQGKQIALWGLSFKPETDDIRESPALKLTRAFLEEGARVVGHDPKAGNHFANAFREETQVQICSDQYEALHGAHALLLLTEWQTYRAPLFERMRELLQQGPQGDPPAIIDSRNLWHGEEVIKAGLRYYGLGTRLYSPIDYPPSAPSRSTSTASPVSKVPLFLGSTFPFPGKENV
ncbi:UDP-glucose dehydrogenase family protein [Pajaroellobacter abortibovis]|uniref:UDP-glucose 6-dehydrogenase n=1 Tax=Pajaroellobacter abortibovis TaxID=1882918 RepID=A0A1L6MVT5_9BACT|nr:UDP-glucose/GDP-mannose dehydrogenase family protein [Pajaroellobacter abortibovis]APR99649.1 hypothetical protein BCY86_02390 [Pajaroellobacter abortibovis]